MLRNSSAVLNRKETIWPRASAGDASAEEAARAEDRTILGRNFFQITAENADTIENAQTEPSARTEMNSCRRPAREDPFAFGNSICLCDPL